LDIRAGKFGVPEFDRVPEFDIVRVEPSGESVVAGHAEPHAKVELIAGDKVLAEGSADAQGHFVLIPPMLAPGDYVFGLRTTNDKRGFVDSRQSVTVSVPERGRREVIVALSEGGKPSLLLSSPTKTAEPGKPAADANAVGGMLPSVEEAVRQASPTGLAFRTAEVENGEFYASGVAIPRAHLRLYLNESPLAEVMAADDGRWSVTVGKGMSVGHYRLRADAIDTKGKVVARAEVPFEVPPAIALSGRPSSKTPGSSPIGLVKGAIATREGRAGSEADAVIGELQTAVVQRGDSLWRISRKVLGRGVRYTLIYEANASQIRDPKRIYPGQIFVLPRATN
jgi:nucleoid-associated protein YgaU